MITQRGRNEVCVHYEGPTKGCFMFFSVIL